MPVPIAPGRRQRIGLQLRQIRCPETRHSIPTNLRREPAGIASNRRPARDIRQGLVRTTVDPRVEEAEWRLALGDQGVVDECDDGGEGRG